MKELEKRIVEEGYILPGNILKVDSFLNHQIDVDLLDYLAKEFYEKYKNRNITKILTIEASGIAIAVMCARYFNAKVIFAKKVDSSLGDGFYETVVHSYTHGKDNLVVVSKKYLNNNDTVFIVDDFLANGEALNGLIDITNQAKAKLISCGIIIEKSFQSGGKELREKGIEVYSLAQIKHMDDKKITFCSSKE